MEMGSFIKLYKFILNLQLSHLKSIFLNAFIPWGEKASDTGSGRDQALGRGQCTQETSEDTTVMDSRIS